jgi:hypothetical protein
MGRNEVLHDLRGVQGKRIVRVGPLARVHFPAGKCSKVSPAAVLGLKPLQ